MKIRGRQRFLMIVVGVSLCWLAAAGCGGKTEDTGITRDIAPGGTPKPPPPASPEMAATAQAAVQMAKPPAK